MSRSNQATDEPKVMAVLEAGQADNALIEKRYHSREKAKAIAQTFRETPNISVGVRGTKVVIGFDLNPKT